MPLVLWALEKETFALVVWVCVPFWFGLVAWAVRYEIVDMLQTGLGKKAITSLESQQIRFSTNSRNTVFETSFRISVSKTPLGRFDCFWLRGLLQRLWYPWV